MNGKNIRISENLKKILDQIIKKEKEKGNENCSYTTASEILYKRIMTAGGLRE